MAIRTKAQLQNDITTYLKSGGVPSLTLAADIRALVENIVDTLFSIAGYAFTDLDSPIGNNVTLDINCINELVISRRLNLTNTSSGNTLLNPLNMGNGATLSVLIENSDVVDRVVTIPAPSTHIDFSGNDKVITIPSGQAAIVAVVYTGTKYIWTLNIQA